MVEVPWEPLAFIRTCVRSRRILWTYHVNLRLERRQITRSEILDSVDSYEIIEEYPRQRAFIYFLQRTSLGKRQNRDCIPSRFSGMGAGP